jgi:hypothetical protein
MSLPAGNEAGLHVAGERREALESRGSGEGIAGVHTIVSGVVPVVTRPLKEQDLLALPRNDRRERGRLRPDAEQPRRPLAASAPILPQRAFELL